MTPDILGWIGTTLSLVFYWMLAVRRVRMSYVFLIVSAAVWGVVGGITGLPSLLVKEIIVVALAVWGLRNWSK